MLGQHKRDITIVPYQPGWVALYEQEAALLRNVLGEKALQIEHCGSTSIPGIEAKPIIDIMVAVESLPQAAELIPALEALSYHYRPRDTVPGRMFFRKPTPDISMYHLNLTEMDSGFWTNQLAFRETLRAHDELAAEYVEPKKRLAEEYARTNQLDTEGKTAFVHRVLELARKKKGEDSLPVSLNQGADRQCL
jgi:GrpB-like predicted nucleotidyltransferase (UPF0157 family)